MDVTLQGVKSGAPNSLSSGPAVEHRAGWDVGGGGGSLSQ